MMRFESRRRPRSRAWASCTWSPRYHQPIRDTRFTDVTLARYRDGDLAAPVPLAGSVCESTVARCMHEHWCDLERLIRCVRGDTKTLYILDIDWEIDDVDDPDDSAEPDPGLTPRILEIAELAKTTPVESVPPGSGRP